MKRSVLILYTGGTIGMKMDERTGALVPFNFDQIESEVPELRKFRLSIDTQPFEPLIDSSNVKPPLWLELARRIEAGYGRYDGFVVLHGTDTMAYSASALSFMLRNLSKPVVFTGSQLPIGVLRTDGRENLISAIEIAASERAVPEVCVFFQNELFRGNRVRKYSAEHFNAFRSDNYPPLASAGLHIEYHDQYIMAAPQGKLQIEGSFCEEVVILDIFPGISRKVVSSVFAIEGVKGVVMRTYGSGNAPTDGWFIEEVASAVARGVVVLNVTQCNSGAVDMDLYETGRRLAAAGVVSGGSITTEAAVTKMMFLLDKGLQPQELKFELSRSLRGEM